MDLSAGASARRQQGPSSPASGPIIYRQGGAPGDLSLGAAKAASTPGTIRDFQCGQRPAEAVPRGTSPGATPASELYPRHAEAGTRVQVLTQRQYYLFRLLCIFRHIACRAALGSDGGRIRAGERSNACLDADAVRPMDAPHQKRKNGSPAPGRDGASKFRAQLDELSPGLLRSPLSR